MPEGGQERGEQRTRAAGAGNVRWSGVNLNKSRLPVVICAALIENVGVEKL